MDEPTEWDVDHVAEWIATSLGLPQYIPNFVHNDIDGDILIHLDIKTLIEIGVEKKEDRETILNEISTLTKHIEIDTTSSEAIELHVSKKKEMDEESSMLQKNQYINEAKLLVQTKTAEYEDILQKEKRKHEVARREHAETLRETENEHVKRIRDIMSEHTETLRETENVHVEQIRNTLREHAQTLKETEIEHMKQQQNETEEHVTAMKKMRTTMRERENEHLQRIEKQEEALREEKIKATKVKEDHVSVSKAYARFMKVAEIRHEEMLASQTHHHEAHQAALLKTDRKHMERREEILKDHDQVRKKLRAEENVISELRLELANARHEIEDSSAHDISKLQSQIVQYDNVVLGLEHRESRAMIAAAGHHRKVMRDARIEFEDKKRHEIARFERVIERRYRDEIEDTNRKVSHEIDLLKRTLKHVKCDDQNKFLPYKEEEESSPTLKKKLLLNKIDLTLEAFETQYNEY